MGIGELARAILPKLPKGLIVHRTSIYNKVDYYLSVLRWIRRMASMVINVDMNHGSREELSILFCV